jgi:hypothetical protein
VRGHRVGRRRSVAGRLTRAASPRPANEYWRHPGAARGVVAGTAAVGSARRAHVPHVVRGSLGALPQPSRDHGMVGHADRSGRLPITTLGRSSRRHPLVDRVGAGRLRPAFHVHFRLYVDQRAWRHGCADELLRAVADDAVAGVFVTDTELRRIHHPYDGGTSSATSTPAGSPDPQPVSDRRARPARRPTRAAPESRAGSNARTALPFDRFRRMCRSWPMPTP